MQAPTSRSADGCSEPATLAGMTFVDLRDRYGLTQLAFNMDSNVELCTQARKLGREFVIKVEGAVRERESKNNRVPTGDIEIDVTSLRCSTPRRRPVHD